MCDCDGRLNYAKFSKTVKYGYERNIKADKWYNIYINSSLFFFLCRKKKQSNRQDLVKPLLICNFQL